MWVYMYVHMDRYVHVCVYMRVFVYVRMCVLITNARLKVWEDIFTLIGHVWVEWSGGDVGV